MRRLLARFGFISLAYLLLILVISTPDALATDVWFGDTEASSANGRFLAKAESPENRKQRPHAFQRNFTYSLTDTQTHRVLWRYKSGKDAEPAGPLFVSDGGEVVSLGGFNGLTLFHPSGERVVLPGVFELLREAEVKKFCEETTAGTFWEQFSWNGFTRVDGKDYFYIRTYWGRYIMIDLQKGGISTSSTVQRVIEDQILKESQKIRTLPPEKYRTYCDYCKAMEVNPAIQKGIFVLVLHHEKDVDRFLKLIFSADDAIMPDAKDYLPRLDASLARRFPKREKRGAVTY